MYLHQIIRLYNDSQGTSSEQALCRLFSQNPATSGPYETRIKYSVHSVGLVKVQSRTTLKSSHPFLYDNHPVLELGYIFVNIYNDGNPGKIIMLRKISSAKKPNDFLPLISCPVYN